MKPGLLPHRALLFWAFILAFFPAHGVKAGAPLLDIQQITSESGLKAWFVEDHSVPVISLRFAFRDAGSRQDSEALQGRAHLLASMLTEGAGDLDSEAFQASLRDNAIRVGFANGRDHIYGELTTLRRHRDMAGDLLNLALTRPRFDPSDLGRIQAASISRLKRDLSRPDWAAARLSNDLQYEGHPYALNSGGTLETLPEITVSDLKSMHKDMLAQANLVIGLTGDLSREEARQWLDTIFQGLQKQPDLKSPGDIPLQNRGVSALFPFDVPQTHIRVIFPGLKRTDPLWWPAQIMNYTLGGAGSGSRLMKEVREERGLTYGISSGLNRLDHAQDMTIAVSAANANASEVLNLTETIVKGMVENGLTDEELADAKSYYLGVLPTTLTSTGEIAGLLRSLQLDNLAPEYLQTRADKIRSVTHEQVRAVAKRLFVPYNPLLVLSGNPQDITPDRAIESLPNAGAE